MSTVDVLTGARVSVNPADEGRSVVEEESDEISLPLVRKFVLFVLPAAAAATASNGLLLIFNALSILGYIIFLKKERSKQTH